MSDLHSACFALKKATTICCTCPRFSGTPVISSVLKPLSWSSSSLSHVLSLSFSTLLFLRLCQTYQTCKKCPHRSDKKSSHLYHLAQPKTSAFLMLQYSFILALRTCLVVAWHLSQLLMGDVITQPKNNYVGEIATGSREKAQVLLVTDRG